MTRLYLSRSRLDLRPQMSEAKIAELLSVSASAQYYSPTNINAGIYPQLERRGPKGPSTEAREGRWMRWYTSLLVRLISTKDSKLSVLNWKFGVFSRGGILETGLATWWPLVNVCALRLAAVTRSIVTRTCRCITVFSVGRALQECSLVVGWWWAEWIEWVEWKFCLARWSGSWTLKVFPRLQIPGPSLAFLPDTGLMPRGSLTRCQLDLVTWTTRLLPLT